MNLYDYGGYKMGRKPKPQPTEPAAPM